MEYNELLEGAQQIKNNILPESNTANLIGSQFENIVEKLQGIDGNKVTLSDLEKEIERAKEAEENIRRQVIEESDRAKEAEQEIRMDLQTGINGWRDAIYEESDRAKAAEEEIRALVTVGRTFVNIAIPTTVPENPGRPVFYLASRVGSYTGFGITIVSEGLYVITNTTAGKWELQLIYTGTSSAGGSGVEPPFTTDQLVDYIITTSKIAGNAVTKEKLSDELSGMIISARMSGEAIYLGTDGKVNIENATLYVTTLSGEIKSYSVGIASGVAISQGYALVVNTALTSWPITPQVMRNQDIDPKTMVAIAWAVNSDFIDSLNGMLLSHQVMTNSQQIADMQEDLDHLKKTTGLDDGSVSRSKLEESIQKQPLNYVLDLGVYVQTADDTIYIDAGYINVYDLDSSSSLITRLRVAAGEFTLQVNQSLVVDVTVTAPVTPVVVNSASVNKTKHVILVWRVGDGVYTSKDGQHLFTDIQILKGDVEELNEKVKDLEEVVSGGDSQKEDYVIKSDETNADKCLKQGLYSGVTMNIPIPDNQASDAPLNGSIEVTYTSQDGPGTPIQQYGRQRYFYLDSSGETSSYSRRFTLDMSDGSLLYLHPWKKDELLASGSFFVTGSETDADKCILQGIYKGVTTNIPAATDYSGDAGLYGTIQTRYISQDGPGSPIHDIAEQKFLYLSGNSNMTRFYTRIFSVDMSTGEVSNFGPWIKDDDKDTYIDTGSANAKSLTIPEYTLKDYKIIRFRNKEENTGSEVTLSVNGGNAFPIMVARNILPPMGSLVAGAIYTVQFISSVWWLISGYQNVSSELPDAVKLKVLNSESEYDALTEKDPNTLYVW